MGRFFRSRREREIYQSDGVEIVGSFQAHTTTPVLFRTLNVYMLKKWHTGGIIQTSLITYS